MNEYAIVMIWGKCREGAWGRGGTPILQNLCREKYEMHSFKKNIQKLQSYGETRGHTHTHTRIPHTGHCQMTVRRQESLVGSRAQTLGPTSTDFPGHHQGAGWEGVQLESKPAPLSMLVLQVQTTHLPKTLAI